MNPKVGDGKIPVRLVYICSPYRAGPNRTVEQNVLLAKRLCKAALNAGFAPFASHLLYTQFLDDKNESDRKNGIAAALRFVEVCDQIWVFDYLGISDGMRAEIDRATELGMPVFFRPAAWKGIWS